MKRIHLLYILCFFISGCANSQDIALDEILRLSDKMILQTVLDNPELYEYQIIYSKIDRDEHQQPVFTDYTLHLDDQKYFYPASTVKMPIAILALEKLHELGIPELDRNSPLKIDAAREPQTPVQFDSTAKDSIPTIGHYVKHVFVVSDNDANNRLYEFVSQDELNHRLKQKGYNSRILHRLGDASFGPAENRFTNPITFYKNDRVLYDQSEQEAKMEHIDQLKGSVKGNGFIDHNDSLIHQPFDFRRKNHFPLTDQMNVVKSIMFPEAMDENRRFNLSDDDYTFVRTQMSKLPKESKYPNYADTSHYDSYVKFFIFGDQKAPMPDHIRIFNKVGWAYGYLTDCSYIVDFKNNVEFLLAATISVNQNGIYNDGQYEYEAIGLPFLAALGKTIYDYELTRQKDRIPDLINFKLDYKE